MSADLCFRLTSDTGAMVELWERDDGNFELLFMEAHRPSEVIHAVELRQVEVELLAEKLGMAAAALATARSEEERG